MAELTAESFISTAQLVLKSIDFADGGFFMGLSNDDIVHEDREQDFTRITEENGYTEDIDPDPTYLFSGGVSSWEGSKITITASGGSFGPFKDIFCQWAPAGGMSMDNPMWLHWPLGTTLTVEDGDSVEFRWEEGDADGTMWDYTDLT